MQLRYVPHSTWPALAWLAECSRDGGRVTVHQGRGVQSAERWFAEAVWDGEYSAGALDETDVIYGSGGCAHDRSCVFVSSASTVDRLNSLETAEGAYVSNSLPCLLEFVRASVDPTYPRYYQDFLSVCKGIQKYQRRIRTSRGDVQLTYFDNLRWDGETLQPEGKPRIPRNFVDFSSYAEFLFGSVRRIAENMRDGGRRIRYSMLGTLSTGYDSPTAATIGRAAGLREVLCFDQAHDGQPDSGQSIAKCLDLAVIARRDGAWRELSRPEVPFLASNAMGEEVRFRSAESILDARVLLTGYHGDKIWDLHTTKLGPDIVRGDPSGLSLTEFRLWAGFIHFPVPFLAVRDIRRIHEINGSVEMKPWDVGGDYTRPICRRIVESAGVPRTMFGSAKKNASVMMHNYDAFLTPSSRGDYFAWIRKHRLEWIRRGRMPPVPLESVDRFSHRASGAFAAWAKRMPILWRAAHRFEGMPTPLRRAVFPWAVMRAQEYYRLR